MENSGSLKKSSEKETITDLVQLIKQIRDYVILDRNSYEDLVRNSKNDNVISLLKSSIDVLQKDLVYSRSSEEYWRKEYKTLLEEFKKYKKKWWENL